MKSYAFYKEEEKAFLKKERERNLVWQILCLYGLVWIISAIIFDNNTPFHREYIGIISAFICIIAMPIYIDKWTKMIDCRDVCRNSCIEVSDNLIVYRKMKQRKSFRYIDCVYSIKAVDSIVVKDRYVLIKGNIELLIEDRGRSKEKIVKKVKIPTVFHDMEDCIKGMEKVVNN